MGGKAETSQKAVPGTRLGVTRKPRNTSGLIISLWKQGRDFTFLQPFSGNSPPQGSAGFTCHKTEAAAKDEFVCIQAVWGRGQHEQRARGGKQHRLIAPPGKAAAAGVKEGGAGAEKRPGRRITKGRHPGSGGAKV